MSRPLAAIAHHHLADPRRTGPGPVPAHLVHEEIPPVEEALRAIGFEPLAVPVGEDPAGALGLLALRRPRVVVNLCDELPAGSEHEMHFAGALELLGLPYTGSPPLALGLCRDKALAKTVLAAAGVPTPPFAVVTDLAAPLGSLRYPLIVKPVAEDGSLGITDAGVVAGAAALRPALAALLGRHRPVLVEEFVEGREVNVPLFGADPPRALPASEIDFSGLPAGLPRICGYEAKWVPEDPRYGGTRGVCPARLEPGESEALERLSRAAFRALGLRDYARVDWRLHPERGPFALEVNPNPDLSPTGGFMRSVRAAGLDYQFVVSGLVELALLRSGADPA